MSAKAKGVTDGTKLATRKDVVIAVRNLVSPTHAEFRQRLDAIEARLNEPAWIVKVWRRVRGA